MTFAFVKWLVFIFFSRENETPKILFTLTWRWTTHQEAENPSKYTNKLNMPTYNASNPPPSRRTPSHDLRTPTNHVTSSMTAVWVNDELCRDVIIHWRPSLIRAAAILFRVLIWYFVWSQRQFYVEGFLVQECCNCAIKSKRLAIFLTLKNFAKLNCILT